MNQNAGMAWTVAGVLAVIVIILLFMMWHAKQPKELSDVLQNGKEDIMQVRDRIRMDCAKTDEAGKKDCAEDLKDLSDLLKEFSTDITNSTTTTSN